MRTIQQHLHSNAVELLEKSQQLSMSPAAHGECTALSAFIN